MVLANRGLKQRRTFKTPCCKKKIKVSFPYGETKGVFFCGYCDAVFMLEFSKIKSENKKHEGDRAHKLINKIVVSKTIIEIQKDKTGDKKCSTKKKKTLQE
jgi:hypothetical protein